MNQKLFHLYNRLKKSFVDEITDIVKAKGGEIVFNPYIKVYLPSNESTYLMYEEVACLQFDKKESTLYANLQTVEVDDVHTERQEYWTPLRDMSFDELYRIAENL
jgi:hypothetical protein